MTQALETGITHEIIRVVSAGDTADAYGNPGVNVFATPALITLFENACGSCLKPYLKEGQFSVGSLVNIRHLGATPLGLEVTASCEIIEIDRRKVVFRVEAHDGKETIGDGTHERFILDDLPGFLKNADNKMEIE